MIADPNSSYKVDVSPQLGVTLPLSIPLPIYKHQQLGKMIQQDFFLLVPSFMYQPYRGHKQMRRTKTGGADSRIAPVL